MRDETRKCAIWARVSTAEQHTGNQLAILRAWAADCEFEVVTEFVTEDSAWSGASGNGKGAEFEAQRSAMLAGVRRGEYSVVLVWAIDRLSRQGTEDMMRYLRLLAENGADVRSNQESWLNTADPFAREILVGVFATLAKYESQRRSERIKAGLARRKADGLPVGGRKPGQRDKGKSAARSASQKAAWERRRIMGAPCTSAEAVTALQAVELPELVS